MAQLQDDGQYVGDEYMVDFEDDAEDQLQAARESNLLDSDSDDDSDVVGLPFSATWIKYGSQEIYDSWLWFRVMNFITYEIAA